MKTDFSAKAPSLGYYFQIRYGLYLLLSNEGSDESKLFFECLDDIEISDVNQLDLYQTKFHIKKSVNLTDRSKDLWKTIRVWADSIKKGRIKLKESSFTLITTAQCTDTSILGKLRNNIIDSKTAVDELNRICEETQNITNLPCYESFTKLSPYQKKELVERIVVLDSAMDFDDLETKIKKILRLSVKQENMESLFERLEGWWFGTSIKQLNSEGIKLITFDLLRNKIVDITSSLESDNLPIDFDTKINISDTEFLDFSNRSFVKELSGIGINKASLKNAISDYLRSYNQRSKWIRESLLDPDDEHKYEDRLYQEWETKFDLLDDFDDGINDDEILRIGRAFYKNIYTDHLPPIYIRPKVTEPFLIRGSFQILAESEKIGFNPKFKKKQ